MVGINLGFAGLHSDIRLSLVRAVKVAKLPNAAGPRVLVSVRFTHFAHVPFVTNCCHSRSAAIMDLTQRLA